jgi:L-lactate dehydrogenase
MRQLDIPATQVIGLGTQLDTARFRSLIAEGLQLPPTQVSALILGEHGDSMVPIWSSAQAAGLPLDRFPGWNSATAEAILKRTRGSGAEVIKLKGGAGFAVGLSIRDVIHAIALDQKRILPVSALVDGPYGIRDVCISIPTVVGRKGVEAQLEIELWPKETSALQHSASVLRETIEAVYKSNPKAAAVGKDKPSGAVASKSSVSPTAKPASNGSPRSPVRVTMGGGGGNGNGTMSGSRVTISGQGQGRR